MKIKFQNREDNLINNKAQDFGLAAKTDYLFGSGDLGLYFSSKDYMLCYIRNKSGLYQDKNSESMSFIYLIVSGNISS